MNSNSSVPLLDEMVAIRRKLHAHPEPGWMEYRTAAIVAERLTQLGYEVIIGRQACRSESRMGVPSEAVLLDYEEQAAREGVDRRWMERMSGGHTAVVGILRGDKPGPVVALRFDMDCVEVGETDEDAHIPAKQGFRSTRPGLMHACAHDGHTAIGLGTARRLAERRSELSGVVRLLFQPAEEGCRGAKSMVDAGWLDDADFFFCGHIGIKSSPVGQIVASAGGFMATAKIDAVFRGRPAHAAEPEQGRNALLAACTAALQLNGISRHSGGSTRINVGVLEGGTGRNVVPGIARMKLETRGETAELNAYMIEEAKRIIQASAAMYGVNGEVDIVGQGLTAEGDAELIPLIEQECAKLPAVTSVVPTMEVGASEDATYMLQKVQERGGKAVYMLFGTPLPAGHHNSAFDFDENVLGVGAAAFEKLVLACAEWKL
jgi:aminobenzoyl-glutamate utilization protein A